MAPEVYRYSFNQDVDLEDVQASLVLSILGVESLHGQPVARLDVGHLLDPDTRTCVIDASTVAGRDLNKLFAGYLLREFGADSFEVRRLDKSQSRDTP